MDYQQNINFVVLFYEDGGSRFLPHVLDLSKTALYRNPEKCNLRLNYRENLKFHMDKVN